MEYIKLKELSKFKLEYGSGASAVDYNGLIRYIRITDIDEIGNLRKDKVSPSISEEKYNLSDGDLLFARSGATSGKAFLFEKKNIIENAIFAGYMIRFSPNTDIINPKYVFYYTRSNKYLEFIELNRKAVAQPNINAKQYGELEIPMVNLQIQNKIVQVLNTAQSLIDKRKQQIEECDELIKSRFIEMFGNPVANEKNWKTSRMWHVAPAKAYNGKLENNLWLLNLNKVQAQTGIILEYIYGETEKIGNSTNAFSEENVLYSKLRPYLNKVVIPDRKGMATSELVPLFPNKKIIVRHFLVYLLRTDAFVAYISEKVVGAKMPRVSMSDFRKFEVILQPINLQNQFSTFVQQVDKQKHVLQQSLSELEGNFNSLMQRAFKGELFPED